MCETIFLFHFFFLQCSTIDITNDKTFFYFHEKIIAFNEPIFCFAQHICIHRYWCIYTTYIHTYFNISYSTKFMLLQWKIVYLYMPIGCFNRCQHTSQANLNSKFVVWLEFNSYSTENFKRKRKKTRAHTEFKINWTIKMCSQQKRKRNNNANNIISNTS